MDINQINRAYAEQYFKDHNLKEQYKEAMKQKPLTFEDIQQIYKDAFGWDIKSPNDNWVLLAREIERRIHEVQLR